ncbi:MAG: HIRAN domain-containing protein [Rhodocyclaceae bacterium]|nr:HIRAN domain-containing protein [Rhodocyclaceae bacterium]
MRLLLISLLWLACAVQAQTVKMLVQSSPLAGAQYYEVDALWNEMKVGDALVLVREPDNPHDARAVRVEWRGRKLGYLPRAENRAVAAEMDRDGRVEARIAARVPHRNPWRRVLIEVFVVL